MADRLTPNGDGFGLFELFEALWIEKFVITVIASVCVVLGALWTVVVTPIFRAEIYVLPAEEAVMAVYNPVEYGVLGVDIPDFSAEIAFAETLNQFLSVAAVTTFVKSRPSETFKNQSELSDDKLVEVVSDLVSGSLQISKNKGGLQTILSYENSDPIQASEFLSELLLWTQLQILEQRALTIRTIIERRIKVNELKMKRLKRFHERRLGEELAVLEEALAIASTLKIIHSQAGVPISQNEGKLQEANTFYLKGVELLSLEIVALKKQFESSKLLRQVNALEVQNQILNDRKEFNLPEGAILAVDTPVIVPTNPVVPNKNLILVLSFVVGIMLGIFFVLIRIPLRKKYAT